MIGTDNIWFALATEFEKLISVMGSVFLILLKTTP